jgi:hypothetical protein
MVLDSQIGEVARVFTNSVSAFMAISQILQN